MNDFIKNKQKQNTLQPKPARKRWSFWVACCIMLFWTVGAILGGISFTHNCVKANADEITSVSYTGYSVSKFDLAVYGGDNTPTYGFIWNPDFTLYKTYANFGFIRNLIENADVVANTNFLFYKTNPDNDNYLLSYQEYRNFLFNSNFYLSVNPVITVVNGKKTINCDYRYNVSTLNDLQLSYGNTYYFLIRFTNYDNDRADFNVGISLKFNSFTTDFAYFVLSSQAGFNADYYDSIITYYDSNGDIIAEVSFLFSGDYSFLYQGSSISGVYSTLALKYMNLQGSYFLRPYDNDTGYNQAYNSGYSSGYNVGVNDGYNSGYNTGYNVGNGSGYTLGYNAGYNVGLSDSNVYTFNSLFGAVIDAPIKAFRGLFSFEVFGVDMTNFLLSIFTVCVIITIIKLVI